MGKVVGGGLAVVEVGRAGVGEVNELDMGSVMVVVGFQVSSSCRATKQLRQVIVNCKPRYS